MLVAEAMPGPYVPGVVAHGWNIDEESPCSGWLLVRQGRPSSGGCHGLERGRPGGGGSPSTLLGPEATGRLCSFVGWGVSSVSGSSTGHEVRVIPAKAVLRGRGW